MAAEQIVQKKKDWGIFNNSIGALDSTVSFLKGNMGAMFMNMLRINFIYLLLTIVIIVGMIGLFFLIATVMNNSPTVILITAVLAIPLLLLLVVFQTAANFTKWQMMESLMEKNTTVDIITTIKANLLPAAKFLLVYAVILAVLIGPLLALIFISISNSGGNIIRNNISPLLLISLVLSLILLLVIILLFRFVTQFWEVELILGKKGVIDSLKASWHIVIKNLLQVFIFDIMLLFGGFIRLMTFGVLNFLIETSFQIALIASLFTSINTLAFIIISFIKILITMLMFMVEDAVISTIILPFIYSFWKRVR